MELQIIQNKIFEVRGLRIMIDFHLAELYQVETRVLKQAVRRNIERFPKDFMFELTDEESMKLINIGVSQSVIPSGYNVGVSKIFAFTELCQPLHNSVYVNKKIM
ncbi:MAG: ORF6N domain-containing protein [Dysgonomonas mossii]|nr:ORF6N domain-containing protein [Dysgonomonas mossii]MBS7112538.1 ORF6N domain-containing protein [Dysgonomonas mossii]